MESDFKVAIHRNNGNLSLKLSGDFDRASARKVLQVLKNSCDGVSKVFINTSDLNHTHPFGLIEREWAVWEQFISTS